MASEAVIPDVSENEKVRTLKQIGNELGGISGMTVLRLLRKGKLAILLEGSSEPTPVLYEDHVGYWAPRPYLRAWVRAQTRVAAA